MCWIASIRKRKSNLYDCIYNYFGCRTYSQLVYHCAIAPKSKPCQRSSSSFDGFLFCCTHHLRCRARANVHLHYLLLSLFLVSVRCRSQSIAWQGVELPRPNQFYRSNYLSRCRYCVDRKICANGVWLLFFIHDSN